MARQQGIQSVEAGLRVLRALAQASRPMTLKEIATEAGLTPSNTHRYLVSFVRTDMLRQEAATGRYDLGPFALHLGLAALARVDALETAGEVAQALRAEIDLPVFVSTWTPEGPVMVRWLESSHPITVNVRPGSRAPLLTSASGRVFLAFGSPEAQQPVLAAELRQRRARRAGEPATLSQVQAMREAIRHEGLARVLGERVAGVNALSAPVFNAQGDLAVSLTTVGLEHAFDADFHGPVAQALRAAAARASARLGHITPAARHRAPDLPSPAKERRVD